MEDVEHPARKIRARKYIDHVRIPLSPGGVMLWRPCYEGGAEGVKVRGGDIIGIRGRYKWRRAA